MAETVRFPMQQAHPWHGVEIGPEAPALVTAYIEIVPSDTVKYEIDKASGHLKVDRPQQFSSLCPTLYGFIPRTYCGSRIAALATSATGRPVLRGDGDPLDICVLTEKVFTRGDFLLKAIPVGGLRLIDKDEADDKIIAVLKDDPAYGHFADIDDLPDALIDRLRHYFLNYKRPPGATTSVVEVADVYGRVQAHGVITTSVSDYGELVAPGK
jgi:inorganic pyrophosphatase